jgi:hypothetical protein
MNSIFLYKIVKKYWYSLSKSPIYRYRVYCTHWYNPKKLKIGTSHFRKLACTVYSISCTFNV